MNCLIAAIMKEGMIKYRIKRVSFSRYVLQEWCIWFPFWVQVDLSESYSITKNKLNQAGIQSNEI